MAGLLPENLGTPFLIESFFEAVMLCQKCNQRPATVFITQTVDNKTTQIHLCEECAGEETALGGMDPFSITLDPSSMLKDFFSALFPGFEPPAAPGEIDGIPGRVPPGDPMAQCPACGFQFPLFKQTGRLGCPQCYQSFSTLLEPVIHSIHGNVAHVEEKTDAPESPIVKTSDEKKISTESPELDDLRARLKAAVAAERFEEAARLRDEISKRKQTDAPPPV
jgi:protein arginine kinase activator